LSSSIRMKLATFSPSTQAGCNSWIIRSISGQRKRLSALPPLFPLVLNGWQGNPPLISVGRKIPVDSRVTSLTSLHFGTSGQCFFSTAKGVVCKFHLSYGAKSRPLRRKVYSPHKCQRTN
jgi:hypothetical protein